MKQFYLFFALLIMGLSAHAQFNYSFTNTKIINSTYTDIATIGTAIPMTNLENGSSTVPQNIGFDFTFNGTVFTQLMIHADGILKFGTVAPGVSTLIAPSPFNSYANVFTNTTTAFQNIVMPFFLDLVQGNAAPQFHILTTGTTPNRITTIQWKNLRDADNAASTLQHQFNNIEFQVKLYETTNNIEMAYGTWLSGTNAANIRGSAIGIKANNTNYISYTKVASLLSFGNGNFEDPASVNGRIFYVEKAVAPISGTSFRYYARFANDVNVAQLYVDEAVPQTPTIGKNIQALIKNEGTSAATNIPVTLTIAGVNSHTETINLASLAAGASQIISFTPFVAAAKGLQTVTISVNPATDDRAENNSLQTTQTISDNVVKLYSNDKKSTTGVGYNGATGMMATKIFGTGNRNLSQIRASFNTHNILVEVSIFEDDGGSGVPGSSPIFTSNSFRTNALNEVIIPVTPGVSVSGDYYVVVSQKETSNMSLRFFNQYPRLPQKIYNFNLIGNNWTESTNSFNPLLTVIQEADLVDVGFENITSPQCSQTNTELVKATIRNFSKQIHDYATNPVTVTGFVKDEVKNVSVPFSFIKNTGTIAAGGRDTVTLLNTLDFTSRGNYVFVANTSCVADAEPLNDSLNFSIFTKITFSGVPVDSICPNTSVTLSIASPYLRNPLNFTSASDGTPIFSNSTITVKPNATTAYYATGLDYRGCTITDSVIVKVKSLGVPVAPIIATIDSILSFKNDYSVVLTSPALAGHTINWVSNSAGGVVSNAGTTYTVSAISASGFNEAHKAFYTRTADGCSSVFSNEITTSFAPGLLISDNLNIVCDTSFYDNGGALGSYNNTNFIKTYSTGDNSKKLKLTINKFNLSQFGNITIFDGSDENAPRIGNTITNTTVAGKYEFIASNPSGELTIRFIASGTGTGFLAGITCQTALQFRSIANGVFTDPLIWESRPAGSSNFTNATRFPNKGDDSIWIMHNVNLNKSIPLDQVIVETAGNLEVTGTNTNLSMYKTIPENELTIKGTFKTNTGTVFGSNSTNILLQGTLINNIQMQTDSVKVFENLTPSIINGNGTIDKLIVNSSQGVLVNGNVNISRELSLLNGIVKINAANYVNLISGLGPVINGGNANSYVDGRLRRQVFSTTDPILFPLGTNGMYRPVSLLANQNSFDFAVEYEGVMIQGAAPVRTLPATLGTLNGKYYHNIIITNGVTNFDDAQITINYNDGDGITDAANLRIAKDDGGTNWLDIGGSGTANGTGSITSASFTSFSDFVLANTTGGLNVLPLKLIRFAGIASQNYNQLNWETENQINSDYFVVEKSTDGVSFLPIGNVVAKQTVNATYEFKDHNLFTSGNSTATFYRLKMVDKDGRFEYSNVLKLENAASKKLSIYPNPVTNKLTIATNKKDDAVITNSLGQTIKIINLFKGITNVNVSTWANGVYYITTKNGTASFIKQ